MSENLKDDVIQAVRKGNCPDYMQNSHACFGCPYGELGETTYICINTRYDKTDIDILDAKMISIDLAQEYPCTKCIHYKPCEEAYDMDLGDNYQYCPYYDDGKAHEKEIKEYHDFLESLLDYLKWDNGPTSINVQDEIEAFLKRMDERP